MDASANTYTDNVTLTFLANPIYHRDVTRAASDNLAIDKKERKFYRKRLLALNRELLKGSSDVEKSLKKAHDGFVRAAIQHFKMVDRKDILQKQYPPGDDDEDDETECDTSFDMKEANAVLMRTVEPQPTLDNFVTTKTVKVDVGPPPPKRKEINLKSDDLRTKGVKPKKKKNKKKKDEKKMS